jgi:hypothetical protein
MAEPSEKEQFDVLYERLKFYHDSAIDAVLKVTVSLLVVIGWVMTSESARSLLAADRLVRWCAVAAIVLFATQFVAGALRSVRRSQMIAQQLDALAYMPPEYYHDLVLRRSLAVSFAIMNAAFSAVALVLVLRSTA